MSLKYGLLGLINDSAKSGYDINKNFKNSLNNFWSASTSQIYREISGLIEEGLVGDVLIFQNDKPNKKILSITEKGKQKLEDWLTDYGSAYRIEGERNPLLLKLFFFYNRPIEEAIEYIKSCKKGFEKAFKEIEESQKNIDKSNSPSHKVFYQLTKDYGLYHYKALIDWADEALKRLEEMRETR